MAQLQGRISDVTAQINVAMLQNTWKEFQYCLDSCHLIHGTNTELLDAKLGFLCMCHIISL